MVYRARLCSYARFGGPARRVLNKSSVRSAIRSLTPGIPGILKTSFGKLYRTSRFFLNTHHKCLWSILAFPGLSKVLDALVRLIAAPKVPRSAKSLAGNVP